MNGYMRSMGEAINALMKKTNLTSKDFAKVVFYCLDGRTSTALAKSLGFDPKNQLQNPLFGALGNTGTSSPLLLLVVALEEAVPGDNILLASYGSGSDALILKVNDHIDQIKDRLRVKIQLRSKQMVPDYFTYLKWRGLVVGKDTRLP